MKKIILLLFTISLMFGQITKIETNYGDSTRVVEFYKNGKIKLEGSRLAKFKHGKWYYYDEIGMLVKVEKYHHGRKVK